MATEHEEPTGGGDWWVAPEELAHFATDWWRNATRVERIKYSRQEAADTALWVAELELTLLNRLVHILRTTPVNHLGTSIVGEARDELRHVQMFRALAERSGATARQPKGFARGMLWIMRRGAMGETPFFITVYVVEAFLLASQSASLRHRDQLHHLPRAVYAKHVEDEAAHLDLAEAKISAGWSRLGAASRWCVRGLLPYYCCVVAFSVLSTPAGSRRSHVSQLIWRQRSPHHRTKAAERLRAAVQFFSAEGILRPEDVQRWRRLGVMK